MTREEAIMELKRFSGTTQLRLSANFWEALDIAIKALEKEPCEDAVSRKAVLELINGYGVSIEENKAYESVCNGLVRATKIALCDAIKKLPSVTPTRKKGKWINKSQKSGCGITFVASECTCCHKKTFFDCDQLVYRYCPNCGAEMDEDERALKYADQDTMMPAT